LYRTGLLPLRSPGEHPVLPEEWARARRDVISFSIGEPPGFRESMTRDSLIRMLPIALFPGGSGLAVLVIARAMGMFPWGMLILYIPLLAIFVAWVYWRRRHGFFEFRPRVIISAMLQQRLCPSCGYSLRTVPPAADGCRICPECGGAWKIEGTTVERGNA
jgi:hypothetical protein